MVDSMSPELIAFLGFITGALTLGAIIAMRKPTPYEERPRIEVRDDLKNLGPGSVVTVSYDAILSKEQRAALKQAIEYQVGQGVKVIVLEGGLKIEVEKSPRLNMSERDLDIFIMHKAGMTDEQIMASLAARGDDRAKEFMQRRRDDSRAPGEVSQWDDER